MSPVNYELKAKTLQLNEKENILFWARKAHALANLQFCHDVMDVSFEEICSQEEYFLAFYPNEWQEAMRINAANYARKTRLQQKLTLLLSKYDCVFATFNFSPEYLSRTNSKTRRTNMQRFLNTLDVPYIANIDFGSENEYVDRHGNTRTGTGREHYHAVIAKVLTRAELSYYRSLGYGCVQCKRIRNTGADIARLSKYVSKLSNHAVKVTTRRHSLLYSRKHPIR